jgi:hypothetical protein
LVAEIAQGPGAIREARFANDRIGEPRPGPVVVDPGLLYAVERNTPPASGKIAAPITAR